MPTYDKPPTRPPRRARLVLVTPVLIAALGLAACTSSGSDATPSNGPTSGGSSAPATSSSAGPSTPANPSEASVANANPITYSHVSQKQAKKLEKIALRAPGVQNIAYVKSTETIQMFLKKDITQAQRKTADRVVNQVLHPAGRPSPSESKHGH